MTSSFPHLSHSVSAPLPTCECSGLVYGRTQKSWLSYQTGPQLLPLQHITRPLPLAVGSTSPSATHTYLGPEGGVVCSTPGFPTFPICLFFKNGNKQLYLHTGVVWYNYTSLALTKLRMSTSYWLLFFPSSVTCLSKGNLGGSLQLGRVLSFLWLTNILIFYMHICHIFKSVPTDGWVGWFHNFASVNWVVINIGLRISPCACLTEPQQNEVKADRTGKRNRQSHNCSWTF